MLRIFSLSACLLLSSIVNAAEKTPANIKVEAAQTFTANGVGAISGPNVRDAITNIADSFIPNLYSTSNCYWKSNGLALSASCDPTIPSTNLTYTLAAAGAATRTISARLGDSVHILDFTGADPTGVSSSSTAFANAQTTGKTVYVSKGLWNLSSGAITTTANAWLLDPQFSWTPYGNFNPIRGFWTDVGNGANLWRLADRVFVGGASLIQGTKNPGVNKTWVGYSSGGLMTYYETTCQLCTFSTIGGIGVSGASRTSDDPSHLAATIGGAFFAVADNATTNATAWGLYVTSVRELTAGTSTVHGIELDVANRLATVDVNSYNAGSAGITPGVWSRCGGETAQAGLSVNPCSVAYAVVGAPAYSANATWYRGLVFSNSGLADLGGYKSAIVMPNTARIEWMYGNALTATAITSFVSAPTTPVTRISFTNSTTVIQAPLLTVTGPATSLTTDGATVGIAGTQILTSRRTGWGAPTGTLDRTALAAYAGQTVSAGYVQAEAQATDNAAKKASQELAALITDLRTHGLIGN